jgi:hypothetical protein
LSEGGRFDRFGGEQGTRSADKEMDDMNKFEYRVYYKYLGPSKDDPFATSPLSNGQVRTALDSLCAILPQYCSSTFKDDSLYVTAVTDETEKEVDVAIERCVGNLNRATPGLSLLIDRLSEQ